MDSPSPVSSVSILLQMHSKRPLLACIRTLKLHFDHGGVDKKGHDTLYRMIQMTSAIGWEVHVTCGSETPLAASVANMEWYSDCLLQGCRVFRTNMRASVERAIAADGSLPDLDGVQLTSDAKIKQWLRKLRTLHKPTGNDRRLFELMLNHYDDVAYQRLVQLHHRKPTYGMDRVLERAKSVYIALEGLHGLAQQADELVLALDQKFNNVVYQLKGNTKYTLSVQQQGIAAVQTLESLPVTVYRPSENKHVPGVNPHISRSFGVAEEELARRGHTRAATFSETYYAAADGSASSPQPTQENPFRGATFRMRRNGKNVPRIFTGSFSQLESDLRKLQLDKVETPVTHNIEGSDPIKIRDFGVSPAISLCRTLSPLPLQRREALVSRDIEFQDRVINGEVVKSRRPSNKTRAQTVDNDSGGLEAWLKEASSGPDTAVTDSSAVRHHDLKNRESTLSEN